MHISWDEYFMGIALLSAKRSKDPSTQVGACIINKDKRIIAIGYNGFPKGIKDTKKRLNDKELKRAISLHAEESAILNAKCNVEDCKIYIYGLCCCSHCAALIIQSGIKEVYYKLSEKGESEHWLANTELARKMLKEAKIKVYKL